MRKGIPTNVRDCAEEDAHTDREKAMASEKIGAIKILRQPINNSIWKQLDQAIFDEAMKNKQTQKRGGQAK